MEACHDSSVSGPRFEYGTSRMRSRCDNHASFTVLTIGSRYDVITANSLCISLTYSHLWCFSTHFSASVVCQQPNVSTYPHNRCVGEVAA
jgi:hypothetical protein